MFFSKVISIQIDKISGVAIQVTLSPTAGNVKVKGIIHVDGTVVSDPGMVTDTHTYKPSGHVQFSRLKIMCSQ